MILLVGVKSVRDQRREMHDQRREMMGRQTEKRMQHSCDRARRCHLCIFVPLQRLLLLVSLFVSLHMQVMQA